MEQKFGVFVLNKNPLEESQIQGDGGFSLAELKE